MTAISIPRVREWGVREWARNTLERFDRVDLVALMSTLVVLLHSPYSNEHIITSLALAAILVPQIRRSGPYWIGVGVYRFMTQVPDHWADLDNHQH